MSLCVLHGVLFLWLNNFRVLCPWKTLIWSHLGSDEFILDPRNHKSCNARGSRSGMAGHAVLEICDKIPQLPSQNLASGNDSLMLGCIPAFSTCWCIRSSGFGTFQIPGSQTTLLNLPVSRKPCNINFWFLVLGSLCRWKYKWVCGQARTKEQLLSQTFQCPLN